MKYAKKSIEMLGLIFKRCICLMLFLFLCGSAYTQLHFASLEAVWQYADQHAAQIKIARAGKVSSGISVQQSMATLMPTVQANGGFTDNVNIQPTLVPASLLILAPHQIPMLKQALVKGTCIMGVFQCNGTC